MTTKRKSTPAIEIIDDEDESPAAMPQFEPTPAPRSSSEYVTFKTSYFYAVLVVLAFSLGILIGYVARGRTAATTTVIQQPAAAAAEPTPAPPVVYDIPTEGYPSFGPEDAPITIVEFSDYQCPYCYRWHIQVFDQLIAAYPDKIRFVYRNFPLSFHQNAFASAEAALCAGDQNAYWKMHDVLFDNQNLLNNQSGTVLTQEEYNKMASDLQLDTAEFESCMTSHKYEQQIKDDMNFTAALPYDSNGEAAVGGTPTFFINGYRLGGAYPIEYFKQIIDSELAKSN